MTIFLICGQLWDFPGGSADKESACNVGDLGLIPGLGRGGHGNPLQYSCLENPRGHRNLAGYSPWGHKDSEMTEQLSTAQHTGIFLSSEGGGFYCFPNVS